MSRNVQGDEDADGFPCSSHLISSSEEFGQARVIVLQALEEEPPRIVVAPFEFVADWADLLQVAVRVRVERLSLAGMERNHWPN